MLNLPAGRQVFSVECLIEVGIELCQDPERSRRMRCLIEVEVEIEVEVFDFLTFCPFDFFIMSVAEGRF